MCVEKVSFGGGTSSDYVRFITRSYVRIFPLCHSLVASLVLHLVIMQTLFG